MARRRSVTAVVLAASASAVPGEGHARDFHQHHVERAGRHVQLADQRIIAGRALDGLGRGIGAECRQQLGGGCGTFQA